MLNKDFINRLGNGLHIALALGMSGNRATLGRQFSSCGAMQQTKAERFLFSRRLLLRGGVLFFSIMIGLDLFAPQVLSGMTPESVLVAGFVAFSIYPKVCYYIVREIRGKEQMLAIANNQVNAGWSESNPQHVAQLETTWKNFKKAIKLKSLWSPSWIYFITVPAMFLVITR